MMDNKTELSSSLLKKIDGLFYFFGGNSDCQSVHDVIKANILANQELGHSIDLLNSTFATQSDNLIKQFLPIISVVLGAILGFYLNRLHWKYTEQNKKEASLFEKLSKLISEIETLSVEYWIKDRDDDDVKSEVYIKSKILLLSNYIRNIKMTDKSIKSYLEKFSLEIFDVITGGEFESSQRKASKSKAISISRKCTDINASLLIYTLRK